MPFDAETVVRAADPAVAEAPTAAASLSLAFAMARDPDPAWAAANPDKCLAFLFVSPRACAAVDVLLSL